MIAAAGLAGGIAITASADSSMSTCTDRSTACLDAVAHSYVDALASDDPKVADKVRAAPNVQKWENGIHNAWDKASLISWIKNTQVLAAKIRDLHLYPDRGGRNVFATYLADGGVGPVTLTSHVIERLQVSHGLITELEIVECIGGPGEQSRPAGHDPTGGLDFGLCARGPRLFP